MALCWPSSLPAHACALELKDSSRRTTVEELSFCNCQKFILTLSCCSADVNGEHTLKILCQNCNLASRGRSRVDFIRAARPSRSTNSPPTWSTSIVMAAVRAALLRGEKSCAEVVAQSLAAVRAGCGRACVVWCGVVPVVGVPPKGSVSCHGPVGEEFVTERVRAVGGRGRVVCGGAAGRV